MSVFMLRIISILSALFLIAPAHAAVLNLPTVTIMADHNLSLAVTEIARDYSRNNQVVVNTSFTSQEAQQKQISEGSSADILITTKEAWINDLKLQGLVDIYSQFKLASDRLVLIGSSQSSVASQGAGHFPTVDIIKAMNGEPMFLLESPETPEGAYAKEALRNLGVASDLEPYTLYVKKTEDIFSAVVEKQAFAICFNSSIHERSDTKTIYVIPESAHKPIAYNAVVIAGDNMDEARKFLDYLKSKEVKTIIKNHGLNTD